MAQFFNDLFSTSATTPVTSHTSDSGHTWSVWYNSGTNIPQVYTASGGILGCAVSKVVVRASVIAPTPDMVVAGSFRIDALSGFLNVGVCARLNAGGTAGYMACYDNGADKWQIYRLAAGGAVTLLASSAVLALVAKTDPAYEFSVTGTTDVALTLKIDGTTVVSFTDPAPGGDYVAAGYPGAWLNSGDTAATGIWISSLSASDAGAVDAALPTMTGTMTSSAITSSGYTLDWSGTTRGDDIGITGFEHSPDGVTWTDVGNVTSKTFSGLAASTSYPNHVRAYDAAAKKSTPALMLDVVTAAPSSDTTVPSLSGSITIGTVTDTSAQISWPAGADNVAVTSYEVSKNGGTDWLNVGNVLTYTFTGLAASTSYGTQVRAVDAAGNKSTPPLSATVTTTAPSGVIVGAALFDNVRFSPYNWEIDGARAKTFRPGAYFRLIFDGQSCVLNFTVSGVAPQIMYQVDGCGAWVKVTLSSAVTISVPANVANSTRHYLEVVVKVAGGVNCWTTDDGSVILNSVTLAAGAIVRKPLTPTNKHGLFYGDSITNGDLTVQGSGNDSADAQAGWAYQIAKLLNSEFGISAFGSTRWAGVGGGNTGIPGLVDSWNYKSSGVLRDFTQPVPPDYVIINMGTNGGAAAADVTSTLNGLIAATPASCKIILLRPFNGSGATGIVNGIAACSSPSRCHYIDTTGFLDTAFVDGSGLHPLAFENVSHIVPQLFPVVNAAVMGQAAPPTLTQRTVSVTLKTAANTLAANLTGVKVSFYDEASPDLATTPRYQSATETTDATGVLSLTFGTTLASGASGHLTVLGAAGLHYNGPAAVA